MGGSYCVWPEGGLIRGGGDVLELSGETGVLRRYRHGGAWVFRASTIGAPSSDACFIGCDFWFQDVRFFVQWNAAMKGQIRSKYMRRNGNGADFAQETSVRSFQSG